MRALGVDPGTRATGYALVGGDRDRPQLHECGVVRPDRDGSLADRLRQIHEGLLETIDRLEPECVVVEGVYAGPNVRTAVILGHARGVAVLAGALRDVQVVEYPPAEIKQAVAGSGNATKEQVGLMVQDHLRLKEVPSPTDASDACAAALCHLFVGTGPLARKAER